MPWRNWSGGQSCIPSARVAPADEGALVDLLRQNDGVVRAVGSGHSFSPLVPTDGTIVSLGNLSGLIHADADTMQSEFWAGTRMSEMGEPLRAAGLALVNMADIDYQTLGRRDLHLDARHRAEVRLLLDAGDRPPPRDRRR